MKHTENLTQKTKAFMRLLSFRFQKKRGKSRGAHGKKKV